MVCPLCEHLQEQGNLCDVCGMRLALEPAAPVTAVAFTGLEPTRLPQVTGPATAAAPVASVRLTGLEPTRLPQVADPAAAARSSPASVRLTDLEPTRLLQVAGPATGAPASVAPVPLAGLEPTRLTQVADRAALPSVDSDPFTNLEPEEAVASDPLIDLKPARPRSIANAADETPRCRNCGLPDRLGVRCTACGVPIGPIEL